MPLADYAHWNEEAELVWWQEEGRHVEEPDYGDPQEDYDRYSAADAFAEECAEMETGDLWNLHGSGPEYHRKYPGAKAVIEWELRNRGEEV